MILLFAGVLVVTEMGYNVNSLIAGLGLGGLTFALAAQDSASNFFGGLVIIFEKPFELGDWISTASLEVRWRTSPSAAQRSARWPMPSPLCPTPSCAESPSPTGHV
ncbi:MAG: mechanosensitive ion channel domain-containing protein [Ruthenibacterium lactatiformans]